MRLIWPCLLDPVLDGEVLIVTFTHGTLHDIERSVDVPGDWVIVNPGRGEKRLFVQQHRSSGRNRRFHVTRATLGDAEATLSAEDVFRLRRASAELVRDSTMFILLSRDEAANVSMVTLPTDELMLLGVAPEPTGTLMLGNRNSPDFKVSTVRECVVCKTEENTKMCTGCRLVYYCSNECQRSHWREHKVMCNGIALTAKLTAMTLS